QPLNRRELGADYERIVLAAVGPGVRQRSVPSGQLVLDDHVGEVVLDVRREGRVQVQAREVTVGVVHLVVGDRAERLTAGAGDGEDRDERQEAVLAGQIELSVDPLDLEQPGDVGVDVQPAARGARAFATSCKAASRTRVVAGEAAVVRARLAVVQVELDTEHGLGAADRELEVRAEARARVPLTVVVTSEVAVVDVTARRRDLVERPGDRHLRRRGTRGRLREDRRSQHREDDEGEYCGDNTSPHYRLLKWW